VIPLKKTGKADLPLHGGRAPKWLFEKMVKLSKVFIELTLTEFGPARFTEMVADPFWLQSFGSFLGFDWHSSGLTTTTLGAIKLAVKELGPKSGLFIAGGKGKTMRKTPIEIENTGNYLKVPPSYLKTISKITAKVDSAWIQDGYNLYHHIIIYTADGKWTVVQQGMNTENKYARRYHWHYKNINDTLTAPHTGINSTKMEDKVLNLTSPMSLDTKKSIISIFQEVKTEELEDLLKKLSSSNFLFLPRHHHVKIKYNSNLKKILLSTYENPPTTIKQLAVSKLGPASIRALAMAAALLYNTDIDFSDPAIFSYAHGGKDGHPYPVDLEIYQNTITVLEKIARLRKSNNRQLIKVLRQLYQLLK